MEKEAKNLVEVLIVALPETAGSALYGMLDVLSATGSIWQTLLRSDDARQYFRVRIVSPDGRLFSCGNGIPVNPVTGETDGVNGVMELRQGRLASGVEQRQHILAGQIPEDPGFDLILRNIQLR